jgi:hypothetical protein
VVGAEAEEVIRALLVAVIATSAGCAAACPAGAQADRARTTGLRARLEGESVRAVRTQVCYLPGQGRGVLSGSLILLDPRARDAVLAGELAHLLVHARDRLGDGCQAGLATAERSERDAAALETRVRARLGLSAPTPDDRPVLDYARRCAAR